MFLEQPNRTPEAGEHGSETGLGITLPGPIVRIVYRSRSAEMLAGERLASMLRIARISNHRVGVTGLLLAGAKGYLQWLEGPREGVEERMRSITLDPRHESIEVLTESRMPERLFAGWDMRLAIGHDASAGSGSALRLPGPLLDGLCAGSDEVPALLAGLGWARGAQASPGSVGPRQVRAERGARSHPALAQEALDHFLRMLQAGVARPEEMSSESGQAAGRTDARHQFVALVEPASRRLGDLWAEDLIADAEVTVGLVQLQGLVRRLGRDAVPSLPHGRVPRVLVTPLPGEQHALGAVLDSEWLWVSGWPHAFETGMSDEALRHCLAAESLDLLDLTLSPAFLRLDMLAALRGRLARFRAVSRNQQLRIRLGGRVFAGQPWLAALVGADAVGASCHGLDRDLARLLPPHG